MAGKSKQVTKRGLAAVKRCFEAWRRDREGGERIPDSLWQMAVREAAIHGVTTTACWLGLNAAALKERMQRTASGQVSEDCPRFIELPWPEATSAAECILETEDRAGRKLRIHLKGEATAQAVALSRALWRDEP